MCSKKKKKTLTLWGEKQNRALHYDIKISGKRNETSRVLEGGGGGEYSKAISLFFLQKEY